MDTADTTSPTPRDNVAALAPYTPGEQPGTRERVIKLNTNEAPFPPHPAVLAAVRGVAGEALRRYPSPTAGAFRQAAAHAHGLTPDHVIATNGGDELLRLAITCYCLTAGRDVATSGGIGLASPTYSLYPVLAAIHNTPVVEVPRGEGFALPEPTELARAWHAAGVNLGFVVNPHAPSGRLESIDALRELAGAFEGLLLVDEAYADFASHDALDLLRKEGRKNVLILRSLSKGYALAGVRFGYGMGDPEVIEVLHKARDSYNTDAVSQAAATAAIERREDHRRLWDGVRAERDRLTHALRDRGFAVLHSESNFLLCTPPQPGERASAGGHSSAARSEAPGHATAAGMLYENLKTRGILVRHFDADRLSDKLRVSVGTPDQNDALLGAIDAERGEEKAIPAVSDRARATPRSATVARRTTETDIALDLDLDGGPYEHVTGVGFFDHMLDHIAKHSRLGIRVRSAGDTHVDDHHTVEDVGLAFGQALQDALGDKRGIERYGHASVPMDDALARVTLDLSGRPALVFNVQWALPPGEPASGDSAVGENARQHGKSEPATNREPRSSVTGHRSPPPTIPGQSLLGEGFDLQLVEEFFNAVANAAAMNLHIETPWGRNNHHLAEAIFKAFGRALRQAVAITGAEVPSTKGSL